MLTLIIAVLVLGACAPVPDPESARVSEDVAAPSPRSAVVADAEGNHYETVRIGTQVWLAQNLTSSHFRNGELIAEARTAAEWERAIEQRAPAWSHYDNDPVGDEEYGKLYNWYAVDDARGLCPASWRVPTDEQWKQLAMALGMTRSEAEQTGWRGTDIGGKLKSTRTEPDPHPRWDRPNTGATNESGFSALPGGYRVREGDYRQKGHEAVFWSSTEERGLRSLNHIQAPPLARDTGVVARWSVALWSSRAEFYRNYTRDHGFSVRCIKGVNVDRESAERLTPPRAPR